MEPENRTYIMILGYHVMILIIQLHHNNLERVFVLWQALLSGFSTPNLLHFLETIYMGLKTTWFLKLVFCLDFLRGKQTKAY